jgi:predicted nucleotidyltransferase
LTGESKKSLKLLVSSPMSVSLLTLKKQIVSTFKSFNPERIILFGSLIGKDWDEFSDVDLIVVYNSDKPFMSRLKELYMSWDIPKAVDIIAYTPSEYNEMINTNFFVQRAVSEGEIIYERGK